MSYVEPQIEKFSPVLHQAIHEFHAIKKQVLDRMIELYFKPILEDATIGRIDRLQGLFKGVYQELISLNPESRGLFEKFFPRINRFLFSEEINRCLQGFQEEPLASACKFTFITSDRLKADFDVFTTLMWYETLGRVDSIHAGVLDFLRGNAAQYEEEVC